MSDFEDRLRFETTAVRKDGVWNVYVESAVSELVFAAQDQQLMKALLLATEEATEEAEYVWSAICEGRENQLIH